MATDWSTQHLVAVALVALGGISTILVAERAATDRRGVHVCLATVSVAALLLGHLWFWWEAPGRTQWWNLLDGQATAGNVAGAGVALLVFWPGWRTVDALAQGLVAGWCFGRLHCLWLAHGHGTAELIWAAAFSATMLIVKKPFPGAWFGLGLASFAALRAVLGWPSVFWTIGCLAGLAFASFARTNARHPPQ